MAVAAVRDHTETRAALARWLASQVGGEPVTVGELSIPGLSGFSNETILFEAEWDGRRHPLVVRVEPSGHQVFPSTEFDAQVEVLRALHADGSVPVPEILWFEPDRSILGDRFLVMARVDGEVPADNPSYHDQGWLPALPAEGQAAVWNNGIDAMARVHRLDRLALGLDWITPRSPAELIEQDRSYLAFAAGDHPMPVLEEALEWLAAELPPDPAAPALCWGDSRIGNMIFAADQSVAAVLDWEMVTAGDPVQDLAWYLLIDRHHHEGFGVSRLPGLPGRDASIERWEAASGRSAEHLAWYELLAGVRYAAVMVRVLLLLDGTGILPGAADMAFDNTGSQLLRRLLDERS